MDEDVWNRAAVLHGFTQFEPVEGVAASQATEVRILMTAEDIYIGIRAEDDSPEGIRATLSERDDVARSDDNVRLVLDTFNDKRRAYVFTVNPLGVQQDGVWQEGGGGRRGGFRDPIDYNPDFLWESDGSLTSWGYGIEIRIPIKTLRFPDVETQEWGLQIERTIQRNGYKSSWAPITQDEANKLAQAGTLADLGRVDPGLFLELNPVVTGSVRGAYAEETDALEYGSPDTEFGMNATYGITSNLTLDATYNPDFSQVEADAGQIGVNERFALFFPEKRPFFLEGTEIFQLPMRLVYTRSIVNPVAGAKITGKVGGLNLGYLGAVDQEPRSGDEPVVNLLRVRSDVGESSTLGLTYTDRTLSSEEYNRVAAGDARLVLGRRYTLTLLGAASRTGFGVDAPARTGTLLSAEFERAGREFSFSGQLQDVSSDFRARSGFIRRLGDTQVEGQARYNRYGPSGALVERWGPDVEFRGFWDHEDFWDGAGLEEWNMEYGGSVSFRRNVTVSLSGRLSGFQFEPTAYEGLFVDDGSVGGSPFRPDQDRFQPLHGAQLWMFVNTWQRVRGRIRAEVGEMPIFDRRTGVPVEVADAWTADGSFTLYPTRSLQAEVGLRHETLTRQVGGQEYSSATIPRVRAQYQFTRALFFRTIVEYNSQDRQGLVDPVTGQPLQFCDDGGCELRDGSDDHDIYGELLLSYEPSPGTVFFVGYSREMEDTRAFRFRDVTPRSDGFFVKGSYRFRF